MPSLLRLNALSLALLVLRAAPLAAQAASLAGTVVDSATATPLAGATVRAFTEAGRVLAVGVTDSGGRFELAVRQGERYDLVVTRLGYRPRRVSEITSAAADPTALILRMAVSRIILDAIVTTVSRYEETLIDAGASVSVVNREAFTDRIGFTPLEHVRTLPGFDNSRKGLIQHTFAVRGDRSANSAALRTMTDYRYASLPSIGFNVPYLIPPTNDDIERIELMRGPGSALYGPNAHRGVLHIVTRSPFQSQGTKVAVAVGERSLFEGTFRHARALNDRLAFKISGAYIRGNDWESQDSIEIATRQARIANGADPDSLLIGLRDFHLERVAGELRVDWRAGAETTVGFTGGLAQAINVIDITSAAGGVQARNWRNAFLQGRLSHKGLTANVFFNGSRAGDTYLLRTGATLVDHSELLAGQLQHGFEAGERVAVTYGVDAQHTIPRTDATVNGQNEDNDNLTEVGVFLHSRTVVSPQFELLAAARADYHSFLDNFVVSPRIGLLFKPEGAHTVRLTYNRAFSPPDAGDLFQDIVVGLEPLPYAVRSVGRPLGYTFVRDCGGLCMRSPFTSSQLGGPQTYLPADAALMWDAIIAVLQSQDPSVPPLPAPPPGQVGSVLRLLNTKTENFDLIDPAQLVDAIPNDRVLTNSVELGYKGIVAGRVSVQMDVHVTRFSNLLSPTGVQTPNVFLEPTSLAAYLASLGVSPDRVPALTEAMASVPAGTVSPREATHPTDILRFNRQGGTVTLWGADAALAADFNEYLYAGATYSWVSDDSIPDVTPFTNYLLNGPRHKGSVTIGYRNDRLGLSGQVQGRAVSSFPVISGVYDGRVDSYGLVDASLSYRLPWARPVTLAVTAYNVLNNLHQEFIGAPQIGRLVVTRLSTEF